MVCAWIRRQGIYKRADFVRGNRKLEGFTEMITEALIVTGFASGVAVGIYIAAHEARKYSATMFKKGYTYATDRIARMSASAPTYQARSVLQDAARVLNTEGEAL